MLKYDAVMFVSITKLMALNLIWKMLLTTVIEIVPDGFFESKTSFIITGIVFD